MTESGERPIRARAAEPGASAGAAEPGAPAGAAEPASPGGRPRDAEGASPVGLDRSASAGVDREALDCIVLVELVTEYLEETLEPAERRRVERHLDECPGCSIYIEQMRETIRAMGRLAPADVPREAIAPLLAAFRASARTAAE